MPGEQGIGAIAEMRGQCRASADSVGDLRCRRLGVADGDDNSLFDQLLDEAWSLRPLRRKRHQANVAVGGFLEALKLTKVGRPDPLRGMRATRAILWRNVRA